jgi:serine/threonine-protein kinase
MASTDGPGGHDPRIGPPQPGGATAATRASAMEPFTIAGLFDIGDVVADRYRIDAVLGEGGMGAVFRCHDVNTEGTVALKLLHPTLARDAKSLRRFHREAKAVARVQSKHIGRVFDFGELDGGVPYFTMEHFDGETLHARLYKRKQLQAEEACAIIIPLLRGLQAAHDAGIIHRDLKPGNVFLALGDDDETVKMLDFGVSKFALLDETNITGTGTLLGTPVYMAPEQIKGAREVDNRSDLYSVGAMLFRALAGRPPHEGRTVFEQIVKLNGEPVPPIQSLVEVDDQLSEVIHRALERDPKQRFANAREFRRALERWRDRAQAVPALADEDTGDRTSLAAISSTAVMVHRESVAPPTPAGHVVPTLDDEARHSVPHRPERVRPWQITAAVCVWLAVVGFIALDRAGYLGGPEPTAGPISAAPFDAERLLGSALAVSRSEPARAHQMVERIPGDSPLRQTRNFRTVEDRWARWMLDRQADSAEEREHNLYVVIDNPAVSDALRREATAMLEGRPAPRSRSRSRSRPESPLPSRPKGESQAPVRSKGNYGF